MFVGSPTTVHNFLKQFAILQQFVKNKEDNIVIKRSKLDFCSQSMNL